MNANVLQQCLTIYLRQPSCRNIVLHDYHNKKTYKASVLAPVGSKYGERTSSTNSMEHGLRGLRHGNLLYRHASYSGGHFQLQDITVPQGQSVRRASSGMAGWSRF